MRSPRSLAVLLTSTLQLLVITAPVAVFTRFLSEPLWRWMNVVPASGPTGNELRTEAAAVLGAVARGRAMPDQRAFTYFSPGEMSHLDDVSRLVGHLYSTTVVLATISGVLWGTLRARTGRPVELSSGMAVSGRVTARAALVVTLLVALQWPLAFRLAHLVAFPSGNWSFSSSSAIAISFPLAFFEVCTAAIVVIVGAALLTQFVWTRKAYRFSAERRASTRLVNSHVNPSPVRPK